MFKIIAYGNELSIGQVRELLGEEAHVELASILDVSDTAAAHGLGKITFHAQTAPAGEDLPMEKVLLSAHVRSPGEERGYMSVEREMDPREARAFATEIVRACQIVEREQRKESKKKFLRDQGVRLAEDESLVITADEILAASGQEEEEQVSDKTRAAVDDLKQMWDHDESEEGGGQKNPPMALPVVFCRCGFENPDLCKPQNCHLTDKAFGEKWGF